MYYADGVGLAAPQIGLSIRMFVVDGKDLSEDRPELKDFKKTGYQSPSAGRKSETVVYQEGCLSVPKLYADVERPINCETGIS